MKKANWDAIFYEDSEGVYMYVERTKEGKPIVWEYRKKGHPVSVFLISGILGPKKPLYTRSRRGKSGAYHAMFEIEKGDIVVRVMGSLNHLLDIDMFKVVKIVGNKAYLKRLYRFNGPLLLAALEKLKCSNCKESHYAWVTKP